MHRHQTIRLLEMIPHARRMRGFTLVEILVTLTLLSVLLTIAVPSFVGFRRNSELTSTANNLMGALSAARGEAMKRSVTTMVMPLSGSNWANGWVAFVDSNFNGSYDAATDIVIVTSEEALPAYLTITKTGAVNHVKYNGSGYSVVDAGFGSSLIEVARNDTAAGAETLKQTRRVKINATGRARVCTPKAAVDATCASTGD